MHAPPTELIEAAAAAPWVGRAVRDLQDVIACEVEGREIEIGPAGYAIVVFSTREKPRVAGFASSGEQIGTFHMADI